MKKIILLLFLLVCAGSLCGETITIGTGTATGNYPLNDLYIYSRSQSLYLASEIGMEGTITNIRWYRNDIASDPNAIGITEIWLMEKEGSVLAGTLWEGPGTLVASISNIDLGPGGGWYDIPINAFPYSGVMNLLVSVRTQNAPYVSPHAKWRYTSTTQNYRMRAGNSDTQNPPNMALSYNRPNIQFEIITSQPTLSVFPSTLDFGYTAAGSNSAEKTYVISGTNLTGAPVMVNAPTGFEVSLTSGGGFGLSLNIPYAVPTLPNTIIFVRFAPAADNLDYSGMITNWGGGAAVKNVTVTGNSWQHNKWCTSSANNTIDTEVFNVTAGTINNSSDCTTLAPGPGSIQNRYSNYFYDLLPADMAQGASFDFSVEVGTCGGSYHNAIKIFIDFNQDGDFADAGEEVYVSPASTNGPHIETGTLAIPGEAVTGYTMMRVVCQETSTPSAIQACVNYAWGETEDYRINITSGIQEAYLYTIPELYTDPTISEGDMVIVGGYYTDTSSNVLCSFYGDWLEDQKMDPQTYVKLFGSLPTPTPNVWDGGYILVKGIVNYEYIPYIDPDHPEDTVIINIAVDSILILKEGPGGKSGGYYEKEGDYEYDLPKACDPCKFAILISGGVDATNNKDKYWENLVALYKFKVEKQNYCPDNVIVNYYDGTRKDNRIPAANVKKADKATITASFNDIKTRVANCTSAGTPATFQKMVTNHGEADGDINLLGAEVLSPTELRDLEQLIINACCTSMYDELLECYGGYVVDALRLLDNQNKTTIYVNSNADKKTGISTDKEVHSYLAAKIAALTAGSSYPEAVVAAKLAYDNYLQNSANYAQNQANAWAATSPGWYKVGGEWVYYSQAYIDNQVALWLAWKQTCLDRICESRNVTVTPMKQYCEWKEYVVPPGGQLVLDFSGDPSNCGNVSVYKGNKTNKVGSWNWNIPGSRRYDEGNSRRVINGDPNSTTIFWIHNDNGAFKLTSSANGNQALDQSNFNAIQYPGWSFGGTDMSAAEFTPMVTPEYFYPNIDYTPMSTMELPAYIGQAFVQNFGFSFTINPMDEYWSNMELVLSISEVIEPGDLIIHSMNSPEPMQVISITEPGVYTVPMGNMMMAGEYGMIQMTVQQAKTNLAIALDCWGLHSIYNPDLADRDFGDAPEGALAYPATGIVGQFPTCITVGPAMWVNHANFGAGFGPAVDFETDGNAGLCPVFMPNSYDADECFNDGDAGLIKPSSFTIQNNQVVSCPNSANVALGNFCTTAIWGQNVDIHVVNTMPNQAMGYVNVLMDWNQDGQWAGSSACANGQAPEHVLIDFPVPNGFNGALSTLNPPSFLIGPNTGYVWCRFTITDAPLNQTDWHGDGQFEDGETEDYLLRVSNHTIDFGDAPSPYPTLLASNGARHSQSAAICVMGTVDYEADGQPTTGALGDDNNQLDDEDGVTFTTPLYTGQTTTMVVKYTGSLQNYLQVWIDYNADGDWADAGEKIFTNRVLFNGNNTLTFPVSSGATVGTTYMRFRISLTAGLNYTGAATNGEVEDYQVNIENPAQLDWGDAPDPGYPTLATSNGARHGNNPTGYFLGTKLDWELNGLPGAAANGDDNNNTDDEDGLTFTNPAFVGQTYQWGVTTSKIGGYVNIWVDFNIDGDWADNGEHVLIDAAGTGGLWTYFITIPSNAAAGNTYIRIRYSNTQGLSYNGAATSGEVEDYLINITNYQYDWGDAPVSPPTFNYPTLAANNGANHFIVPTMHLGNLIDGEADGQPSSWGSGDDVTGLADEDGILYNWPNNMVTGYPMNIKVYASTTGKLDAWMDFNADGDWNDAFEQIFTSVSLSTGDNYLSFVVPRNASTTFTPFPYFSRYRFSTAGGLTYTGTASDGEVEDHAISFSINNLYQWSQPYQQSYSSLSGIHCHDGIVGNNLQIIVGADDFTSYEGNLAGIIWYGSYEAAGSGVKQFHLSLHSNTVNCLPVDPETWGVDVPLAFVNETATGNLNSMGEMIYKYTYILPTPIQLIANFNYWIDISSLSNNSNNPAQWKWQEASRSRVPALCAAATRAVTGSVMGAWSPVYWSATNTYSEMAFQILSEMDFGDAPSPYPTTLVNNGACHSKWWTSVFLGNMIDYESDGKPTANADGDDLAALDDEDGIVFMNPLIIGQAGNLQITVTGSGLLQGWIDFNCDGDWNETGEQIINNLSVSTGTFMFPVIVPPNAVAGQSCARFRICTWTLPANIYDGYLPNGEVEDYAVTIVANNFDWGDAPDPTYPTLAVSGGANHFIDGVTYLGALIDNETDGIPTINADGDDFANLDDEEGVTVIWPAYPGKPCKIRVVASVGNALFNGWIDFNQNGSWAELNEHIFVDLNLQAGVNFLNFVIPANAQIGNTYARFRFSHQPALSYTGTAYDGEVEDYVLNISDLVLKWQQLPDTTLTGFHAHNSQNQVIEIADDWLCSGGPITSIRWYGNYELLNGIERRGSWIDYFHLGIYANDPQNCRPSPAGEIWGWDVPLMDANETSSGMVNPEGGTIYDYVFKLYDPFDQDSATRYWLAISAYANDSTNPAIWRWQAAGRSLIPVLCPAATRTTTDGVPGNWTLLSGAQPGNEYDMAFALISDTSPAMPSDYWLRAGAWFNPETWHNWLDGTPGAVTPVTLHCYDPDNQIQSVTFSYNLNNTGFIPFYTDTDGTQIAKEGSGNGSKESGDGWCGYFISPTVSQSSMIVFSAEITLTNGMTEFAESFFDVFFDISAPSSIEMNATDWMELEEDEFMLDVNPNRANIDKIVVVVEEKKNIFFKGIPLVDQHKKGRAFSGSYHCSPTAAAACLQYFADSTGDNTIMGGLTAQQLVDRLAWLSHTNRRLDKLGNKIHGTFTNDMASGLVQWIANHGNNYTVRGPIGFNWQTMRNELERCQDVLTNVNWPNGGGHTMTFNSIVNKFNLDGTVRVDFMDPWTGQIEYGNLNPGTGLLSGYNPNIGAMGTIESLIIVCPKELNPQPGGVIIPGPNPYPTRLMFPDIGLYWVRIITLDLDGKVARKDLVINRVATEFDWGDAPDPTYPTLLASNGARHKLSELYLGDTLDFENDGQPHLSALGDDLNNLDDEDGIVFTSNIVPGSVVQVTVTSSGAGYLQGWLDINHDGDWNDAGEKIFNNMAVVNGANYLTFTVNPAALAGKTFARFRLSSSQNLGYSGSADDGEVEDYMVYILNPGGSKMHWPQLPKPGGWDVEFAGSKLADDFRCTESGPISNIRFWISWAQNAVNAVGPFTVSICNDIPAGVNGNEFSMPGDQLWTGTFNPGQYEEMFMQDNLQGWFNMPPGTGFNPQDHNKWKQITISNIANAFNQTKGTIYWLVIKFGANNWQYKGWKESNGPQFNDVAVFFYNPDWIPLYDPIDGHGIDLSFVISSNPFMSVNATAVPPEICIGNSVQLDAIVSGGSGTYNYYWTSAPAGFVSNLPNPVVYPAISTRYYVKVHDGTYWAIDSVDVTVHQLPAVLCPQDFSLCVNAQPYTLTGATPVGGVYSGTGVSNGIFYPGIAGVGIHTITYTFVDQYVCANSCMFKITVKALPNVQCPQGFAVCLNDPPVTLSGATPVGGTYSGTGVVAGKFYPSTAGVGVHIITYTYTDPVSGCTNTCTFQITVKALPNVQCPQGFAVCLNAPPVTLTGATPVGGTYSGTGVAAGKFYPSTAGVGVHIITYTYADPTTGCTNSCTFQITVKPLPNVTCPQSFSLSVNDPPYTLTGGTPVGGTYSGTGVAGGKFYPSTAGIGTHTITYTYTDPTTGCSNSCTFQITVLVGHLIPINTGWSGISSYLQPVNPAIEVMFSPIMDNLIILYNMTKVYWPDGDVYTLETWDAYSGYVIKVNDDVDLPVSGFDLQNKTVNLNPGWNLIPVLSNEPYNIEVLLGGLSGFVVAKDVAGPGVYWTTHGINTIGNVLPGKAYYVRMNVAGSIDYSLPGAKASIIKPVNVNALITPWNPVISTPASHLVAFNVDGNPFLSGDIIGAFTLDGWCAGLAEITNPSKPFAIDVNGNDRTSPQKDGFEDGEPFNFKRYHPSTGEIYDLEVTYNPAMDAGYFANNALSEVNAVKISSTSIAGFTANNIQIYPNPNDGTFTITGTGKDVKVMIYNGFGKEIYFNRMDLPAKVDISTQPKGIYFIRIETGNSVFFEKLVKN